LSRDHGIDAVLQTHELDAILTPGSSGANLTSRAGYPIVAVPFGMIANTGTLGAAPGTPALPAAFKARPAPFGVGFTGTACSEPRLIAIAYAFEQASLKRVPPPDMP
jgi:amidase